MLRELESEIASRLDELNNSGEFNLKVINAPNANQTVRAKAIALVFYESSSFDPPAGIVSRAGDRQLKLRQREQLSFAIVVEMVDLRCHEDSYPLLEAIIAALSGYRPIIKANFDVLFPTAINFIALEDGSRYAYRLNFSISRIPS